MYSGINTQLLCKMLGGWQVWIFALKMSCLHVSLFRNIPCNNAETVTMPTKHNNNNEFTEMLNLLITSELTEQFDIRADRRITFRKCQPPRVCELLFNGSCDSCNVTMALLFYKCTPKACRKPEIHIESGSQKPEAI